MADDHPDDTLEGRAYRRGWNDAMRAALRTRHVVEADIGTPADQDRTEIALEYLKRMAGNGKRQV